MVIRYIRPVALSIALIILASISYLLATSLVLFSPSQFLQVAYLFSIMVGMPVGFILFSSMLTKRYQLCQELSEVKFSWKSFVLLAIAIFLINFWCIQSDEYVNQFIIATCEEFLFRYLIYRILKSEYPTWLAMLVTSLLFGVLLHMNYPLLDNLIIRTPLGLLFSVLATRFGLQYAIGGHWIYNLLVSRFPF
ncbi:CPBP family intramembrane metalloprotease [Streptococcus suis]|nr:CPBP family intramembrane metalloprotease [Streptococcus suis]HEM4394263.1 CPBP family intramembrane metalloprotease [Streptococcus suis]